MVPISEVGWDRDRLAGRCAVGDAFNLELNEAIAGIFQHNRESDIDDGTNVKTESHFHNRGSERHVAVGAFDYT